MLTGDRVQPRKSVRSRDGDDPQMGLINHGFRGDKEALFAQRLTIVGRHTSIGALSGNRTGAGKQRRRQNTHPLSGVLFDAVKLGGGIRLQFLPKGRHIVRPHQFALHQPEEAGGSLHLSARICARDQIGGQVNARAVSDP